jgi:hypothetical protein
MSPRQIALAIAFLAGCAAAEPVKKPTGPDEFQGFGALRGEPREKKKPKGGDDEEKAAGKGGKGEEKGGKGEEGGEEATGLTKEQVLGAIQTAQKRVDACRKKFKDPGIYVVEITISPDGSCTVEPMRAPTRKEQPELWTDVEGPIDGGKNAKSPTNKCLATALTQVKFPAFDGKPVVVTYPLILR